MRQQFLQDWHELDAAGNPHGGVTTAPGLTIVWQRGPLGRGVDRKDPNGAFVETVIAAAASRLEFYQASKFAGDENAAALEHLLGALFYLNKRTSLREAREVEGTHTV